MELACAVESNYVGRMTGKISCKSNSNQLIISITTPFNGEISVRCDDKIYYAYYNTISLIEPQSEHIEECNKCYYHTEEEDFYITQRVDERIVRKKIHPTLIIEHAKDCQKLQSHFGSLRQLHKGQACSFSGYAIDRNNRPMHPTTVESSFHKYTWFYNPFTFDIEPLDENTIDDFVKGTPISKEMTNKMVLYHQKEDKIKLRRKKMIKRKNAKEKREVLFGNINNHFEKYEKFYKYGVIGGVLWLINVILQLVI
ncbi:hypothetical protein JT359_19010 [Candidatus Poribacteria bacterium]|nr:hypothetical protein [Candidatus Poribacteria bacterium]